MPSRINKRRKQLREMDNNKTRIMPIKSLCTCKSPHLRQNEARKKKPTNVQSRAYVIVFLLVQIAEKTKGYSKLVEK